MAHPSEVKQISPHETRELIQQVQMKEEEEGADTQVDSRPEVT